VTAGKKKHWPHLTLSIHKAFLNFRTKDCSAPFTFVSLCIFQPIF
jgi:hypothetical protein